MRVPAISFPVRLNRYISACGRASRRKAEELITEGRVTVDGRLETSVGRVLGEPADVRVDGLPITLAKQVYIVMNKPRGVLSAVSDEREKTVIDLLPDFYGSLGIFPVGRLDKESEGLIILTNDGKFAQELIHPSSGVRRTYFVILRWNLDENGVNKWANGVMIDKRFAKPLEVAPMGGLPGRCFAVALGEGFKREIRSMAAVLGNRVQSLTRTGIGNLFLKKLPSGAFNEYNYDELREMIFIGGEV
ncbi:MAG: rRNA pseudouridine synthase [Synergistaceae bacterium]|jgi:23S rRNA pseudouridine2605 synthase|nr:rRNA pseudouridine synthase [Synergistaceae bacterium]